MPKMTFILKDGSRKEVDAPLGLLRAGDRPPQTTST
jgi:hypothetical protein